MPSLLLVAMSGLRVRNTRLNAAGMTLPGLAERGAAVGSLPSLGLLTLAAHTPPHWQSAYRDVDDWNPEDLGELATYDLVAVSSLSARILDAYRLCDALRAVGCCVVLGGLHVSALPREALAHADAVVQGEGEAVWPSVLEDFEHGRLGGIYSSFEGGRAFDLAQARTPRYDLLDRRRSQRFTLQTTRGCPLDCSFCASSRTISRYQKKPMDQIALEVEAILDCNRRPIVELADDNTFVDKSWGRELAGLLGRYPIRWFTETDVSVADDSSLLAELAGSGLVELLIGFESAAAAPLRGLDGRDWKLGRRDRYREQIERIQSHGIAVNGCFILGFDEEGEAAFDDTARFVRESELAAVQVTLLTPFPGTALHRRLTAEGRLLASFDWSACTLFDATFHPRRMGVAELEQGFFELVTELYGVDETARRAGIFRECMRKRWRQRPAMVESPT